MPIQLAGIFPPVPTPFDSTGEILPQQLAANIARWNSTGLRGYVILGSNGEAVMLTEYEKVALWQAAREAIPRDKLFLVGAGMESTRASIALAKRAAEFGADAAMFITPSYYKGAMKPAALIQHYRAIADASPIPTIIYNMPAATALDIDADTVIQLAEHPNIIGIKDSSGSVAKYAAIVRAVRPDFAVLAGSGGYAYPALCVGAQGAVAALANIAPRECVALYDAFRAGRHNEAHALQLRLVPLNAAVTTRWSVPGLKAALEELQQGFYGGPPRLPLQPLGAADRAALRQVMQQAQVI